MSPRLNSRLGLAASVLVLFVFISTIIVNGEAGESIRAPTDGTSMLTGPPDVFLHVPTLSVGKIELTVDNLVANLNLNADVASLVKINAGVAVSIKKVNLSISDVEAKLDLTVRLGHLVDIVNRVFKSLDLHPLLLATVNNVTSIVGDAVDDAVGGLLGSITDNKGGNTLNSDAVVDGLIGSITQGGNTLDFIVDDLGNIVQQFTGAAGGSPVSTVVGDYHQNMTFTGVQKTLSGGLVQRQYSFSPLDVLVNIVFNAAGQVVKTTVEKKDTRGSSTIIG